MRRVYVACIVAAALVVSAHAQMRGGMRVGFGGGFRAAPVRSGPATGAMYRGAAPPGAARANGVRVIVNPVFPGGWGVTRFGTFPHRFGFNRFRRFGRFNRFNSQFCAFNPGFCGGFAFNTGFGYGYGYWPGTYDWSGPYDQSEQSQMLAQSQRELSDALEEQLQQNRLLRMEAEQAEADARAATRPGNAPEAGTRSQGTPAQPGPSSQSAPYSGPPRPPTVLVFRDRRQIEVRNYAISGSTLYDFDPSAPRRIAVADLDVPATEKANDERGLEFRVPRPNVPRD